MPASVIETALASLDAGAARVAGGRARALLSRIGEEAAAVPATLFVVVCLVGVWSLERALTGQVPGARNIGYLAFGALPNAPVIGRGSPDQLWRFISSGLVHDRSSPLQLVANSTALIVVGSVIERLYGQLVMLSTLVLGVVAGGITWMLASELGFAAIPDYTVGCSAGVCALVGMMLVYGYRHRASLDRLHAYSVRAEATLGIALMLLIGLVVPNLNNVAHAGGLGCGALLALVLPIRRSERTPGLGWRAHAFLSSVVVLSLMSIGFAGQNLVSRIASHS